MDVRFYSEKRSSLWELTTLEYCDQLELHFHDEIPREYYVNWAYLLL